MKMRRLELIILAITMAFAFFMGGYFTGRNQKSVNITAATIQQDGETITGVTVTAYSQPETTQIPQYNETDIPVASAQDQNTDNNRQGTGIPQQNDGKININTATIGELTDLPGIGNTLAARIVDYRTQNGSFARIEDIQNVSGIGERRYEAIMDLIKIG